MALIHEYKKQGDFLFKYRGVLPLLILFPALIVYILHEMNTVTADLWYTDYVKFGAVGVCLLGLAIRVHAVGHSAKNTSGRNTDDGQIADEINSTGMYSVVRHPLYLGNFFMWLGPALWTMDVWFILFFIAAYWLYYERIMYAEEAFLRSKFGDRYDDWAAGRPAFIPKLSGYQKPHYSFNFKKILRQEKNGFTAIFLVFWLFHVSAGIVNNGMAALKWDFWSIAAAASFVIYLILKFLKRKPILRD